MTCCVEQKTYGHHARKPTMLYVVSKSPLPELAWGATKWKPDPKMVERYGLKGALKLGEVGAKGGGKDSHWRIYTPPPFRDLLISIASTARPAFAVAAE